MWYIASGCEDMQPPAHTWMKRSKDVTTVGCHNNDLEWKLTCLGGKWIGDNGNCTNQVKGMSYHYLSQHRMKIHEAS